ncbi:MAG: ABC transporter permease [Candidatus Eremiobacteraeota bacterium]|nr:ABC transporter permease [Candidatus Eremiobacteraeota bacterium]MBV9277511.1 ABC transporter permease [Candidatus Eremiobacteraeota bacterium]
MKRVAAWPFVIALVILAFAMLWPTAALLLSLPPSSVVDVFSSAGIQNAALTSLVASLCAVVAATVLGVPAAYELARWRDTPRSIALFVLALPLAFPPVASGIILLNVIGIHAPLGAWLSEHGIYVIDSLAGVALAEFFVSGSFVVIASSAAFHAIDPAYEEAAATLGASRQQTFWRIALPLAAPNILAGVLLAWLRAIGEYGATSIVAYRPTSLPIALYVALSAQGLGPALALSYGFVVLAALVIAVQWAVRRHVV